ncbi:YceI family protein [Asticcacaulis sp.]|uniref:YceI family protein n=1 Tax=Asticcacaulis sp. TaxID=1872648 RepID=UPI002C9FB155|nr:YceI family protein [Asticcacaulis sp.]HTM80856.1 YceI family protein [Asticcacaulis sp.]
MLRFAAICIALGLMAGSAQADTLTFEPDHTSVIFQYPHFGLSHPSGKIMGATGTLTLDHDDLTKSAVDITLDMTTLTTALPAFDALLKSEKYFAVAQFPTATFKSAQVELTGENTANITGDLTIHGVTQSEVLAVTFNKKAFNPAVFKTGYGFSATAHLSRRAFGLGNLEPIVGDDIDLIIDAEAY